MTVWAGAIPFAQSAPVAIAYSEAGSQSAAPTTRQAPEHTFGPLPSATQELATAGQLLRVDPRLLIAPRATDHPADATPVPLSTPNATPKPNAIAIDQATDDPEPTDDPDPTATTRPTAGPTDTPEPASTPTPKPTASPTPKPTASPTPKPTASPTPRPTAAPTPAPTAPPQASYTGRSHFWFPALNIDVDWGWYGCDYGGPDALPGGVWRWGCGPQNNIYLLSHAWSTFKKLKTAYHNGNLQVGQNVWYANAQGDVTKFEIKWIRNVTVEYLNATANEWALNDSPTPIMTLQTCDGADDQLRIIVRLAPAN